MRTMYKLDILYMECLWCNVNFCLFSCAHLAQLNFEAPLLFARLRRTPQWWHPMGIAPALEQKHMPLLLPSLHPGPNDPLWPSSLEWLYCHVLSWWKITWKRNLSFRIYCLRHKYMPRCYCEYMNLESHWHVITYVYTLTGFLVLKTQIEKVCLAQVGSNGVCHCGGSNDVQSWAQSYKIVAL